MHFRLRRRMAPLVVALALACHGASVHAADPAKVLHVAFPDIDTLDPQQFSDDPSYQVVAAIFEPLYEWDYLA